MDIRLQLTMTMIKTRVWGMSCAGSARGRGELSDFSVALGFQYYDDESVAAREPLTAGP